MDSTSPDEDGQNAPICKASTEEKVAFTHGRWNPFLRRLKGEIEAAKGRKAAGFLKHEVLPPQSLVLSLAEQCLQLTATWHGRGNLSVVYEFLMEVADLFTPYCFNDIPCCRSEDLWVRLLDGSVRSSIIADANKSKPKQALYREGSLNETVGASAIDNCVLPNIMSAVEARVLLVGSAIKNVGLRLIAARQRRLLSQLHDRFIALPAGQGVDLSSLPVERLMAILEQLDQALRDQVTQGDGGEDDEGPSLGAVLVEGLNINPDSLSWQLLCKWGSPVQSWGQLNEEQQQHMEDSIRKALQEAHDADLAKSSPPPPAPDDPAPSELADFVAWCQTHPCELYKDKATHRRLLVAAMMSPDYTIVKRSTIEKLRALRLLVHPWDRQVPLHGVVNGKLQLVRDQGADEFSRFRKNDFCYFPVHGLGISSGGVMEATGAVQEPKTKLEHAATNVAFEMGGCLVLDPTAKLGNWLCTDIEKICQEVVVLNPTCPADERLLGESWHEVAQNPMHGSSIGATQHTQVCILAIMLCSSSCRTYESPHPCVLACNSAGPVQPPVP